MRMRFITALSILFSLIWATAPVCAQSQFGRLTGTITGKDGKPLANVEVSAVNQTSGQIKISKTKTDGKYLFRLNAGAYRLRVLPPFAARFERGKAAEYGKFADVRCGESTTVCETLENLIVSGEAVTKIDFAVAEIKNEIKETSNGEKPNGAAGKTSVDSAAQTKPDRREVRDRWRIAFPEYDRYGDQGARGRDVQFNRNRWFDPYSQNVLKGDYPVVGNDIFLILSAVSTTGAELRRTPLPTNVSSENADSNNPFGRQESFSANETLQFSFELFKGDSTFRPRDWAIKISPTFSVPNYFNARERGVVNIDPRRGTNRTDYQISLEDAFVEKKLFDVNKNYDFVSVRAGIQPFVSDFRGFVYSDNNLGARVFGGFDNNKSQFNLAYFEQIDKDTNSGLLDLTKLRKQTVYIANIYRQDFFFKGYTAQASALFNNDRGGVRYDSNGFLVRPTLVGTPKPHYVRAAYLGFNGDGHIGFLNLSHSFYYVFGRDEFNGIAGKKQDIRAQMGAVELSVDRDYLRFRTSVFYASGDKNPTDGKANGFDSIIDDPNFVGGQFSYWNRQGIRLISTDVGLVQGNSLLPNLRSSKIEGQSNFVNPGIQIFNAGVDVEITPTLKAVFNLNYLRFSRTESLEYILFQPRVRHEIGFDTSLGVIWRPLNINNVQFTFGASEFQPGKGFRDIFTDATRNCPIPAFCSPEPINPSKRQYALFTQFKLIY